MGTKLAVLGNNFEEVVKIGKAMAKSGYFKDATAEAQAIVKVMAGREMGFGPFASMNGINIIKGKPAIGANLMASAVRAHPAYDYRVETLTDELCVLQFFYNGKPIGESSFDLAEAHRAGVGGMRPPGKPGTMLEMHPKNMLFSRAMSNGVRWYCPDVFSGNAVYTPDELGDGITGDVIEAQISVSKPASEPAFDETADAAMVAQMAADANQQPAPVSAPQPTPKPVPTVDGALTSAKQIGTELRRAAGWTITNGEWLRSGGDVVGDNPAARQIAAILGEALEGVSGVDAEKPHHVLLAYLFKVASAKMLTIDEVSAIKNRWSPVDQWHVTEAGAAEIRVMFNAAMRAAGQTKLPLV